jgi:hypothetical protein
MRKSSFPVQEKVSISLSSLVDRQERQIRSPLTARMTGFGAGGGEIEEGDEVAAILEVEDAQRLVSGQPEDFSNDALLPLSPNFVSAHLPPRALARLVDDPSVGRIQTKKLKLPTLDHAAVDIALRASAAGPRAVPETGGGVHTGPAGWDPVYGFGKIDVVAALHAI